MAEENQEGTEQTAEEIQAGQFTPPEATSNLLTKVTEEAALDTVCCSPRAGICAVSCR